MTPAEQRLLRLVAARDECFSREVHTPGECERCDAEVCELQKLERKGWITLRWRHMSHHGELYAASPLITEEGEKALAESDGGSSALEASTAAAGNMAEVPLRPRMGPSISRMTDEAEGGCASGAPG